MPAGFTTDQRGKVQRGRQRFQAGRIAGTMLLWFVFILNLAEFYALQSWLPTILTSQNYTLSTVATATSLTTTGGIIAAFVGWARPWTGSEPTIAGRASTSPASCSWR